MTSKLTWSPTNKPPSGCKRTVNDPSGAAWVAVAVGVAVAVLVGVNCAIVGVSVIESRSGNGRLAPRQARIITMMKASANNFRRML